GGRRRDRDQVHHSARRHDYRAGAREIQRLHRARHQRAARGGRRPAAAAAAGGVSQSHADRSPEFPIHEMTRTLIATIGAAVAATVLVGAQQSGQPPAPGGAPATQQPSDVSTTIVGADRGAVPRFAVPDFIALSNDAETKDAAQTIGRVLWDDLNFEREFALIPRDVYTSIPAATSISDVPFDRWREVNADGVIVGTVQRTDTGIKVEVRVFNVSSRQSAFAREYAGSAANKRLYAH